MTARRGAPVVAAWGMGVDSTAMIIEWVARRQRLDVVLTADPGAERPETYHFLPLFQHWMDDHGIEHHVVRYQPRRFKNWPPYFTILENCLTNATLPSASFNRKSCSVKWKIFPQNRWVEHWPTALAAWARGDKVVKLIGYDASPADSRRYAHREGIEDPRYDFRYPLREWGWDRDACTARIQAEGLPIPVKSSCVICAAMRPEEVATLPRWALRLIVLLEARAAPRLRTVEGLWHRSTRARPGSMTAFIRERALLGAGEIDAIIAGAPVDLVDFQRMAAALPLAQRPMMRDWIERFNAGVDRLSA
ncbi:hypothetical protein PYV00_10500 [Novosphingobium sp. H3SJ31-1]|uniref:Phosphoadenosine phosphosulphate reductase domain-containing protein n=1 Tax=Novosphingobium album (ex Liu et al. 2023) TaxID=3031130 RepID=A0ABT5WQ10_9SPHN|nr:hypothetical protein [Novosphingobium album (ex Liu et al. 2023)]MDE8652145.1 hypothetical protein [Novosphingobium album (ex Liu et al. 2023)]